MPTLQSSHPVALLISDIHLSLKPPIWRSAEEDWLKAMKRSLDELKSLQESLNVPILCAGDIFDRWFGSHQSAELINFALNNLPEMIAVPGQHDLPNHNLNEIKRSAYWTLVQAGKIHTASKEGLLLGNERLRVVGVPWNEEIPKKPQVGNDKDMSILLIHKYAWMNGYSYSTAKADDLVSSLKKDISGYDVAVFGDNHKGFQTKVGQTTVYNCGGFFKRKSDEIKYEPRIGILYNNKEIEEYKLDTSKDKYIRTVPQKEEKSVIDMKHFIKCLEELGDESLDFEESIRHYVDSKKVNEQTKKFILEAMGV